MTYILKKLKGFSKKRKTRRTYLLLEVLIAFFLIAVCAVPLFYPHAYMLKSEKNFIKEIEFERSVDLIFADILEKLYRNEIPWEDIQGGLWKEIDSSYYKHDNKLLSRMPYKGKYRFTVVNHKKGASETEGQFDLRMVLVFEPKNKDGQLKEFEYAIAATRKITQGTETIAPPTNDKKEKGKDVDNAS